MRHINPNHLYPRACPRFRFNVLVAQKNAHRSTPNNIAPRKLDHSRFAERRHFSLGLPLHTAREAHDLFQ